MSNLPRVYVTRRLPAIAQEQLARHAQVITWPGESSPPRVVLMKELAQADALIATSSDYVDATMLAAAPHLRIISVFATSFDTIDLQASTERGILVTNAPEILAETTADFTLALMLAASRRIIEATQYVRAGGWRASGPEALIGRDLFGATLGIVGLGRVGRAVAWRARSFGMNVLYSGPNHKPDIERETGAKFVELEELLTTSDVVSLHCPFTDETYQLIDHDTLEMMRPDAILVNTARGPLIDTRALVDALRSRPMIAALDVTDPTPLPADHALLSLPNAIVTPHLGGTSARTHTRMALMAVENVLAALRGEYPPSLVNRAAWPEKMLTVGDAIPTEP